ncbi:MAG: hypothetical protein M1830_004342 [Pleopsidium flavum]|nr:MAG: hypothetical protein M1830_004342 [Pleopsidium flavum]
MEDTTVSIATVRYGEEIVDIDNQLISFHVSIPIPNLMVHQLLARIDPADRPTDRAVPNPIRLSRRNRMGMGDLNITHPQEAQALFVQAYGTTAQQACSRCLQTSGDSGPDLFFSRCRFRRSIAQGACGDCLMRHNARGCSFHPFYEDPVPSAGILPSVEMAAPPNPGNRRGTRASTRTRVDDAVAPLERLVLRRPNRRSREASRSRRPSTPRPRSASPVRSVSSASAPEAEEEEEEDLAPIGVARPGWFQRAFGGR